MKIGENKNQTEKNSIAETNVAVFLFILVCAVVEQVLVIVILVVKADIGEQWRASWTSKKRNTVCFVA